MKPAFLDKSTKPKTRPKSRSKAASRTRSSNNSSPRRRIRAETDSQKDSPRSKPSLLSLLIRYTSIILILLLGTGTLLYIKRDEWGVASFIREHLSQFPSAVPEPKPDPDKYANLITQLDSDRANLKARFLSAATAKEQEDILSEASLLLEDRLPSLMRCWLGHPWDFNGTATVPGEGKIACGYYVSVIMRDAGFKINRIRVAQQPSQNIIRTFVDKKEFFEVKTNTPYPKYVDDISKQYEGIHIVGLDKHVAFIVIKNGEMRFIHSGGLKRCVVDEGREDAYSLEHSNYRVISNISRNRAVLKKWILGKTFDTVVSN